MIPPSSTISALPATAATISGSMSVVARHASKDSLVFFQVGRFIEFYGPQRFLAVRTLGLRSAAITRAGYAFTAGFPTHLSGLNASRANKKGLSVLEVRQLSAPIQQDCPPRVPGSVLMPNWGTESRKGFFTPLVVGIGGRAFKSRQSGVRRRRKSGTNLGWIVGFSHTSGQEFRQNGRQFERCL